MITKRRKEVFRDVFVGWNENLRIRKLGFIVGNCGNTWRIVVCNEYQRGEKRKSLPSKRRTLEVGNTNYLKSSHAFKSKEI